MSLAEQPIPSGRSLPRCALTHPHAHCLAGHPWAGSACGNAACGKGARSQEPNGKADKRNIQRGLEEPLLKALHHTASGCRQLSRGTETKRNLWQQRFFLCREQLQRFFEEGKEILHWLLAVRRPSTTRQTQVFAKVAQRVVKPTKFSSGLWNKDHQPSRARHVL